MTSSNRSIRKLPLLGAVALACAGLAGCVTGPSPVEVTRFHQPATLNQLGTGTIFVESANVSAAGFGMGGVETGSLEMATYKAAVARELVALGYRETDRATARQIVTVGVDRFAATPEGRRSPVSVGVGGNTGSYGSGVGVGLGINLGGGPRELVGTEMAISIRDKTSEQTLWEGRANFTVDAKSALSQPAANADAIIGAIFREFPGNNGETIEVKVK